MTDVALYRDAGLEIYEKAHYSHGEHIREVEAILSWYGRQRSRVLDLGCSGGLHALEMAKRGHSLTGIDMEASAIALARERNRSSGLDAGFLVADLEDLDPSNLGRFDLVYSLGNVISHIPKISLPGLLARVRSCLAMDGIFLFDILTIGDSFPESISEEDLGITWERRLDRETGEIFLRGIFERFGVNQDFRVWGHDPEEIAGLLRGAGFAKIDVSPSLDFSTAFITAGNAACLRYRAKLEDG
jgi:SAM-dependent methyltransferase